MNKEYNLAVAFLQFKGAYEALVKASRAMPDIDLSDNYPFFLLDFEEIQPVVSAWCVGQASALMKQLPEQVDNPGCVRCSYFRGGLNVKGLCVGAADKKCQIYPTIVYSRAQVLPFLAENNVTVTSEMTDEEVQLLYMHTIEEVK